MNTKFIVPLIVVGVIILSGCAEDNESQKLGDAGQTQTQKKIKNGEVRNPSNEMCKEEKVPLANYGDPGKRLANCFVEYPGEPTRPDKSYYIVEDICGQFTKEFMENMLGRTIVKIEQPKISTLNNCSYYFDDKEYVMLVLSYLSVENQKAGQESMGRKVVKDSNIPKENLVAYQEDGNINSVYFILGPEKFISLQRSSKAEFDNEAILAFSAKLGEAIKKYK